MHPGGEHPRMATHNCLLKLGEKCYLEVIAINPNQPKPGCPRWFGLDEAHDEVRLQTWLARSNDIRQAAANAPLALGDIASMSRGQLQWLITIRADGSMPLDGIAPSLIQWPDLNHPAGALPESGCELVRLDAYHPQTAQLAAQLQAIGFIDRIRICELAVGQQPYLLAHINTPAGLRQL